MAVLGDGPIGTDVRRFHGLPDPQSAGVMIDEAWTVLGLAGTEEIGFCIPPDDG